MDGTQRDSWATGSGAWTLGVACALLYGLLVGPLFADEFRENFEDERPTWRTDGDSAAPRIAAHRRVTQLARSGKRAEQLLITSETTQVGFLLTHDVTPARLFPDLKTRLWIRSNRPGIRVGMRLKFPHQIDPRSGRVLEVDLLGGEYTEIQTWQQLECQATERAVAQSLARVRAQIARQLDKPDIDMRDAYVDRVLLILDVEAGPTELLIDELVFGPVVPPVREAKPELARRRERRRPVVIGDDRLSLEGEPFFPMILPYHGESLDALSQSGINVVWIDDADDQPLLSALGQAGLSVMASVPPAAVMQASQLRYGEPAAGLLPIPDETSPILFWNVGTRIPTRAVREVGVQAELLRNADRHFIRPIVADVVGREREYSRKVDLLGASRHIVHTTVSPTAYLELLEQKRRLALPGKPVFTWIGTEPSSATLSTRSADATVPVVEPEQIWMQGYAALSAGCKAIGFWKYSPLNSDDPGAEERRLAIELFATHVRLLQRWLAAGKVEETVPVLQGAPRAAGTGLLGATSPLLSQWDHVQVEAVNDPNGGRAASSPIRAAVIRSESGLLVLPVWYGENGQFQPSRMTAEDLRMLVPGVNSVQAWEITTTSVRPFPLTLEQVPGGTEVRLSSFDQFTAILIPADASSITSLQQDVAAVRARMAESWVGLARAKLERVRTVHEELDESIAPRVWHARAILSAAERYAQDAERELSRANYDHARVLSRKVLELTRILQRKHWENAIAKLSSPVSSPHTICYSTLPDHWRLLAAIGGRPTHSENLLPTGSFESVARMSAARWHNDPAENPEIRAFAELVSYEPAEGDYCLRLVSAPADREASGVPTIDDVPIRMTSPPVMLRRDQIVVFSGRVRVMSPLTGSPDGLMVYDSLKGTVAAQRWSGTVEPGTWQPFALIRRVHQDGPVTLTLELRGFGEVHVDDLQIRAIEPH